MDFAAMMEGYRPCFGTQAQPDKPARITSQVAASSIPGCWRRSKSRRRQRTYPEPADRVCRCLRGSESHTTQSCLRSIERLIQSGRSAGGRRSALAPPIRPRTLGRSEIPPPRSRTSTTTIHALPRHRQPNATCAGMVKVHGVTTRPTPQENTSARRGIGGGARRGAVARRRLRAGTTRRPTGGRSSSLRLLPFVRGPPAAAPERCAGFMANHCLVESLGQPSIHGSRCLTRQTVN